MKISSGPVDNSESSKTRNPGLQPNEEVTQPIPFDKALRTRNICALAVLLGWVAFTCSIGIGVQLVSHRAPIDSSFIGKQLAIGSDIYCSGSEFPNNMNLEGHRTYSVPKGVPELINLGLTTIITMLVDSMSYIHSTTLRWALVREGRLHKNSNLRLFSSSKTHFPNKWYINIISLLSLGVIYGAVALLTEDTRVYSGCPSDKNTPIVPSSDNALDFNGWGVITLGAGLFIQALVCTCSLCNSAMVVTWSSNPLKNARAYSYWTFCSETVDDCSPLSRGKPQSPNPDSGTPLSRSTTVSLNDKPLPFVENPSIPSPASSRSMEMSLSNPQDRQHAMLSIFPRPCRIRYIVWGYFGAFSIWTAIMGIVVSASGRFLKGSPVLDGSIATWEYSAIVYIPYTHDYRPEWVVILAQIFAQSSIVFGLHCIELVVNMSRDESFWRKAATKGAGMEQSSVKLFTNSWQSITLMMLKSITQWVFGQALSCGALMVSMALFPLIAMAGLFLLLAIFTEYLVRRKPKGYQPATYGDIQRLSRFIDDWDHKRIFWGDKGEMENGIRRAGTAGHRLSDVRPDTPYIGLS